MRRPFDEAAYKLGVDVGAISARIWQQGGRHGWNGVGRWSTGALAHVCA